MLVRNLSINDSNPGLYHSSHSSNVIDLGCLIAPESKFIFVGFFITNSSILLLLCLLILYHRVCEWKLSGPTSSLVSTMSHSDFFTYHLVLMKLIGTFGCITCTFGIYLDQNKLFVGGALPWSYSWYGETLFHIVTCLDRYLAVVHPLVYMQLRNKQGIRKISASCVWLLSFIGMSLLSRDVFVIMNICTLTVVLAIVAFCSFSTLLVLVRPCPGQSKRRAFYTILAILVVLILRFVASLFWALAYALQLSYGCLIMCSTVWFTLPSSLVLPLLFLHRAEKILCCKIRI